MKNLIIACLIGLLAGVFLTLSWVRRHEAKSPDPQAEKSTEASKPADKPEVESGLKLSAEKQKAAGIRLFTAAATNTIPTSQVFGRVIDGSSMSTFLAEITTAGTTLVASSNELSRLKLLYGQNQNISARTLEMAQATFQRDSVLLETARIKLRSIWGPTMRDLPAGKDSPDVQAIAASLADQDAAVVRLDIPMGSAVGLFQEEELEMFTLADETKTFKARYVGVDPTVDPVTQGRGLFYLVTRNSIGWPLKDLVPPVGTPMSGWLAKSSGAVEGIFIPQAALLRNEGRTIVYVRVGEDIFKRVVVELLSRTNEGWLVEADEEIKAGAILVVSGGAFLLSEELSKAGGGE